MKISKKWWGVVGVALVAGAAFTIRSGPKAVIATKPVSLRVSETISASGRLRGQTESAIGATNGGRIAKIFVREGDRVKKGRIIAQMDDDVLNAQMAQAATSLDTVRRQIQEADAGIDTARSQLLQASRPPLASDVERLKADIEQNASAGRSRLASAKQRESSLRLRYEEVKSGPRKETIAQALSQAQQAEVTMKQQEREWNRQKTLYAKEVVARVEMERAETNYLVAKKTYENADSKLSELQNGNRAEQIAQAQADWLASKDDTQTAEANLTGVIRSGDAQLKSLLATPRPEDIEVAKRRLDQAIRSKEVVSQRLQEGETAIGIARSRLSETRVEAPFDGTITQIVTEIGAILGPNGSIVRLVRTGKPEIRVDLDEANLGKLKIGQEAFVTNDAFPDSSFKARISAIGAQVDTDRGVVEVRLIPVNPPVWVRPGQTFTVNIQLGDAGERLIVPPGSVTSNAGISTLLVVEKGKVVKKSVKILPMSLKGVPVLQGVTADSEVIVDPTGLLEGDSVRIKSAKTD